MKNKLLINIQGGVIQSICANSEDTEIVIIDYDNFETGEDEVVKMYHPDMTFKRYADCMGNLSELSESEKEVLQELINYAYQEEESGAVYEIANEKGLPYSYCKPCDAETPAILDSCAICGTTK